MKRAIIHKLDRLAKEYLAKQKKFDDIADDYLIGLISLKYVIGDDTAFTIMREKFKYLINVYETHDKSVPISGYLRPFLFDNVEIEHDMHDILDFALYLALYEDTDESKSLKYELARQIFYDMFLDAYAEMRFDCEKWPIIIGLMSRFEVFNDLPYEDVRKIIIERCNDPLIISALEGKVETRNIPELTDSKVWIPYAGG